MPSYYLAYGLTFSSSIALPFPKLAEDEMNILPDVVLTVGSIPKKMQKTLVNKVRIPGECVSELLLNNENLYEIYDVHPSGIESWVHNGSKVILSPQFDLNNLTHLNFFLYTTLMAVVHTRGLFPFHASAIELNNGAAVFLGDKGAGKSTIGIELLLKGGLFLADDICLIQKIKGDYLVIPTTPFVKIKEFIFDNLPIDERQAHFEEWHFLEQEAKYLCKINPKYYPLNPVLLSGVYQLTPIDTSEAKIVTVPQTEKIAILMRNPSRPNGLKFLAAEKEFAKYCFAMSNLESLPFFRLIRPKDRSALPALVAQI